MWAHKLYPGCIIHANTLTTHYSYVCEPLALAREMYINVRVEIILLMIRLSDYVPKMVSLRFCPYPLHLRIVSYQAQ